MGYRTVILALLVFTGSATLAQTATQPASPTEPAAPASPTAAPLPMGNPTPAARPVTRASGAADANRPIAPGLPAPTGVTQRVQHAAAHDTDARGHTLDPHGKPVGQAPAPTTTSP